MHSSAWRRLIPSSRLSLISYVSLSRPQKRRLTRRLKERRGYSRGPAKSLGSATGSLRGLSGAEGSAILLSEKTLRISAEGLRANMLALGGQTSRAAASTSFVSSLYDFSLNGQPTIVERRDGVDFFFNE